MTIRAKAIANELVLERTHLLKLVTDPRWNTGSTAGAAKEALREYVERLVEHFILSPDFDEGSPERDAPE